MRAITPAQLGLAGAAQLILIISTLTQKGKTTTITRQYFVYGEIPGQNGPVAATYMDTLVITVTY